MNFTQVLLGEFSHGLDLLQALFDPEFGDRSGIYVARRQERGTPKDATDATVQRRLLALCKRPAKSS
jgi:hypothetical protein